MIEINLDRPWNGLAIGVPSGYFLLVQRPYTCKIGDEIEVHILNYPFPQPILGKVEDLIYFNITSIKPDIMMLLKQFYGMNEEFIRERLVEHQFTSYQILGVRSISYVYQHSYVIKK